MEIELIKQGGVIDALVDTTAIIVYESGISQNAVSQVPAIESK
jgi:hypothetical protein